MHINFSLIKRPFLAAALTGCLLSSAAQAQPAVATDAPPLFKLDYTLQAFRSAAVSAPEPTAPTPPLTLKPSNPVVDTPSSTQVANKKTGWYAESKAWLGKIWDEGREEIYVSGYAYHDPGTYTAEKLATLNNYAWGGGYGRVITSDRGNDHGVYAMAFLDSHKSVQPNVGYYYQAIWGDAIRFGAGATVVVASRPDIFGGVPFPAVMPLFSVGTKNASLMFVPIPKLSNSQNVNNGNVLFIFGRLAYK